MIQPGLLKLGWRKPRGKGKRGNAVGEDSDFY